MTEIELWNNQFGEEEAEAAYQAVMNRCVSDGRIVKQLEEKISELLNIPYVIAVPNGTSALMLALMGIGIKPGDEVIVPDITFIATANAAKVLGATVVIADTQKDVPVISEESVMQLITGKTKAIISVHINGHIACTEKLKLNLSRKGIFVIDDACQAFMSGNVGNYAGNSADIACYSMGITKTAACGQGGFITTHSEKLYRNMRKIKTQGLDSIFECENYTSVGFNFKISDILAAIGVVQLGKIQKKLEHMWEVYNIYQRELKDVQYIKFIPRRENELPWMTYILCEDRNKIRKYLEENKIAVRKIGDCLHRAPYLEARGSYVNSEKFEKQILSLPSGPDQPIENVLKICSILKGTR